MFLAAAYGSVSDIEVLWMLVAFTGMTVTAFNLKDAILDLKHLIRNGIFNGRRVVARTTVYTESTRMAIHSVFLFIGILASFLPEAPDELDLPLANVLIGAAIRWGLIASSLVLMSQSVALRIMRNELRRGTPNQHTKTEKLQTDVGDLARFAREADDRRIAGPLSEADVTREKE